LDDDSRIRKVKVTLEHLVFGELRRILSLEPPPAVAAMILACCALDFLAGLAAGKEAKGKHVEDFVRDYMPTTYEPIKLVTMRHKLVHNYSLLQSDYTFTAGRDELSKHMSVDQSTGRK
jgi:hypothetical protein